MAINEMRGRALRIGCESRAGGENVTNLLSERTVRTVGRSGKLET
jgi:hypothetical protein